MSKEQLDDTQTQTQETRTNTQPESVGDTQPTNDAPALSEHEQRAYDLGWRPKSDFDGDPDEWVSAREFLKRGELFGRINEYKHQINGLTKTVDALVKHNQKMFESQYKQEIADIKLAKKQALREQDFEAVEVLEEKLEQVQEKFEQQKEEVEKEFKQQQPTGPHPAWEPWVQANSWYTQDPELRGYADGVAAKIAQEAQRNGASVAFEKLLGEVARKTRQRFPEKFTSGERKRTVDRDDGEAKGRSQGGLDASLRAVENSLNEGEKEIMNNLVKQGVIKKDEYLKQIQAYNKRRGRE